MRYAARRLHSNTSTCLQCIDSTSAIAAKLLVALVFSASVASNHLHCNSRKVASLLQAHTAVDHSGRCDYADRSSGALVVAHCC